MLVHCRDGTAPGLECKPATLEAVSQSSFARDPYRMASGGKQPADKLLLLGLRLYTQVWTCSAVPLSTVLPSRPFGHDRTRIAVTASLQYSQGERVDQIPQIALDLLKVL